MMLKKVMISALCFCAVLIMPVRAVFVTDLIGFSKMALEYSKQLKTLKEILGTAKKLKEDLAEFKGKFSKIHSGLKKKSLDVLLNFRDIEFYFKSPYVIASRDAAWKAVWENSGNLFKKFKFLKDQSVLKKNRMYKENREFRDRADYRIMREEEIYSEYRHVLEMIADTRDVISKETGKYGKVEEMIRRFSGQRSTGKMIALICDLKLEQMIKMDILLTSLRMRMEMTLKEKIIRMDMAAKREREMAEDREKGRKALEGVL
jgi:hypothetical protein